MAALKHSTVGRSYFGDSRMAKPSFSYFNEYYQAEFEDISLVAMDGTQPLAIFVATRQDKKIGQFDEPCRFFVDPSLPRAVQLTASKSLCTEIEKQWIEYGVEGWECFSDGYLDRAFHRHLTAQYLRLRGGIWLDLPEELIRAGIRRSYKSLLNWGKKNLQLRTLYGRDFEADLFWQFHQLHVAVAGRETRSVKSWQALAEMVEGEHAFVTLAFADNELVSANYCSKGTESCNYGVSVSRRDIMGKGVSLTHFPLYRSVLFAKELGLSYFDLGVLDGANFTEKEKTIADFKRGFAMTTSTEVVSRYNQSKPITS